METDRQVDAMLPPPPPDQITSALLRTFKRASLARDSPWPRGDKTPASRVNYLGSAPKTPKQRAHAARLAQGAYAAYRAMEAAETAEGRELVQRIYDAAMGFGRYVVAPKDRRAGVEAYLIDLVVERAMYLKRTNHGKRTNHDRLSARSMPYAESFASTVWEDVSRHLHDEQGKPCAWLFPDVISVVSDTGEKLEKLLVSLATERLRGRGNPRNRSNGTDAVTLLSDVLVRLRLCEHTDGAGRSQKNARQRLRERLRRILNVALRRHRETKPARNKQI